MNKTIAMIAVILTVFTAVFVITIDNNDSDGAAYVIGPGMKQYYTISDADTTVYTDEMLTSISSSGRYFVSSDTVCANAFKDCTAIKHLLFRTTTSIGESAFEGCTGLYTVISQDKLETIGNNAFKGCTLLMQAQFTSDLTAIGSGAFEGCTELRNPVLFGTSVSSLEQNTFKNSGIIVEDLRNVTSISSTAFSGTSMRGQILSEGQTAKVNNVQSIYVKDFALKAIEVEESLGVYTLKLQVENGVSLMGKTTGSSSPVNSENETWVGTDHFCRIVLDGTDLHLELLKYRIHFESYLDMTDVVHISGEGTYTMPTPTVGASIFKGWRITGFSGYVTSLTESDFQTAGMLIEPVAEFNELTLTLDHSAVSSSPDYTGLPTSVKFSVNGTYPAQNDIIGYTFSGWRVGEVFYSAGSKITNLTDHTAKSVWDASMLTLTLVHADNTTTTQQIEAGSTVSLANLITSEPDSKRFIGWSAAPNGTVLTTNPQMDSDMTLYSVFTDRTQYTIRYLDGNAVLDTQTGYDGRTVVLDMDDPEVEGKVFIEWRLDGHEVESGDQIVLTGDLDILAIWNTVSLNITYHVDSNEVRAYDYGDRVTVDCNAGSRAGYGLSGWSTTENGPVVYSNGDEFTITNSIDLYPCWVENGKLVVTLHDYLGRSSQTEVDPNSSYTIPNPTQREGKTFSGWAIIAGGNAVYETGNTLNITDNTDLFEIWSDIIAFAVTMHHYDSTTDSRQVASGGNFTIPAVEPREAYDFKGWASSANGSAVYRDGESLRISSNVNLYEVWQEKETFTVTVHCEPVDIRNAYEGQTITVTLPSMNKTGYDLAGWSKNANASSAQYSAQTTVTSSEDTDYYPVWTAKQQYLIKVHLTGTSTTDYRIYAGDSVKLPTSLGTSNGKTHEGWTTKSDGTGKFYSAGSTIYPTGSMELYTYWSDPEILKLDLNEGNTNLSTVNIQKGDSYDLSRSDVSKEGYLLKGWSKSRTSSAIAYKVDDTITPTSNTTLYAVWEKLIAITFMDGGSMSIGYYEKGAAVELPELSSDGLVFLGWTLKDSDIVLDSLTAEKDTEISSSWKEAEPTADAADKDESQEVADTTKDDAGNSTDTEPAKGGSGINITAIGLGAAVAVIVSALVVFQIRRA